MSSAFGLVCVCRSLSIECISMREVLEAGPLKEGFQGTLEMG